jgi:hypothetical protein
MMMVSTESGPFFYDLKNFKWLEIEKIGLEWPKVNKWETTPLLKSAASADGSSYVISNYKGTSYFHLIGNKAKLKNIPEITGNTSLNDDGTILFSTKGHIFLINDSLNQIDNKSPICIPTIHPAFYLSIHGYLDFERDKVLNVYLCTISNFKPMKILKNFGEFVSKDDKTYRILDEKLPLTSRIFASPDAKKLFYLDYSRKNLYTFPISLEIEKKGLGYDFDYVYVCSASPTTIYKGQKYEYPIKLIYKANKIGYKLVNGPKGMTINDQGVISWSVPFGYNLEATEINVDISGGPYGSRIKYYLYLIDPPKPEPLAPPQKK